MIHELERTRTSELDVPAPLTATATPSNDTGGALAEDRRPQPEATVQTLTAEMNQHPLWSCRLLRACQAGHLTLADWQYLFAQYAHYSGSFTRFLAAAIAGCPSDYYRSRLTENLWEESGGRKLDERHAEIFREFLRNGLALDPASCRPEAFTERFVEQYLEHCLRASPASVAAFLALGTEATVPRLYRLLRHGLERAGVVEPALRFFTIHIACDDEHAATLLELMLSYSTGGRASGEWEQQVRQGMQRALDLRLAFFEHLYQALVQRRLRSTVERIQSHRPPTEEPLRPEDVHFPRTTLGPLLYANVVERLNVEFAVERVPFAAEVLDPRLVHIPPGRCNERHKHAHESVFFFISGRGRVLVGDRHVEVEAGDMIFVPRWVLHQSENLGSEEMIILAMTDYGLTSKAFIGDYDRTARLKRSHAPDGA